MKKILRKIILKYLPNSERLRSLFQYPLYRDFCKKHINSCPSFSTREQMYNHIINDIIKNKAIQYLEFGVYKGNSLNYISTADTNIKSTFTGFDSFDGLPECWIDFNGIVDAKKFDTKGEMPIFNDQRITLVKGLFQDTLPFFLKKYNPNARLVINNDSDLYSSTMYMLTSCNSIIKSGSIIIFDEFFSPTHEFRALQDYCSSYRRTYDIISNTNDYRQIAIMMH